MSNDIRSTEPANAFATLRRFIRPRPNVERCELCSADLPRGHQHLVDINRRELACACQACALLFYGQAGSKYRRVPSRVQRLPNFNLSDGLWERLLIPIQLAFFFYNTPAEKVTAIYPSPAGPTESLLSLDVWEEIVAANPVLTSLEPDVEALLVNRNPQGSQYYIAPIDSCYELVGLLRTHWRGLSGGQEVWTEIAQFFSRLEDRGGRENRHA